MFGGPVGGVRHPRAPRCAEHLARVLVATLIVCCGSASADVYRVANQTEYKEAVQRLAPGDEVVLANGTWQDFEILFEAQGLKDKPISLVAETAGKVVITGRSNLKLAGNHLIVRGLTFRDGYSPTRTAVITFRRDSENLANHSRVTDVVIEGFSKPKRTEEDRWIDLYGQHNRVDHNYFAGKTNRGPTLVVGLDTPESRDNEHVVEHNFFGHRPSIGGNGGETIRIGVSDYSRTRSATKIVRNYFERCDGEVEIISVKAEGNVVAENVFYESRGAVVFRHGGNNEVLRNVFFGNGVSDTGGVRVINENQTVRDNYFEGLSGEKFLSALTIMNGVPNSPINRYHQVKNAEVSRNSFIGFDAIGLAVGSDEERSAAPIDSVVSGNLFITDSHSPVSVFDDISGIRFEGNLSANEAMAEYAAIAKSDVALERAANGLLYPVDESHANLGAPRDLQPIKREQTGPTWFEKPPQTPAIGKVTSVRKGSSALRRAIAKARDGDTLELRGARYELKDPIVVSQKLTIRGQKRDGDKPLLTGRATALFEIVAGGELALENVAIAGHSGNRSTIRATGEKYDGSYALRLTGVDVTANADADDVAFLSADADTFATSIDLDGVSVIGWPGTFLSLSGAKMEGWYLAEDIRIQRSSFAGLRGPLIDFGREGRDESTFGPRFVLENSALAQVNPQGNAIHLKGIDGLKLKNNLFLGAGQLKIKKRVLGLGFGVAGNEYADTPQAELLGVNGEVLNLSAGDSK